jgi:hypothetical protein
VLPSPTLPTPYLLAHTFGTPAPAIFDKLLIDACAIEKEQISKCALVVVVGLKGNFLPEGESLFPGALERVSG